MNDQARVAPGVPSGGQFATTERGESTVTLAPIDVPSGSFLYPPVLRNADEAVAFWSTVEIPDEVLARLDRAYVDVLDQMKLVVPTKSWNGDARLVWERDNPAPSDPSARASWESSRDSAEATYAERMRRKFASAPDRLNRADLRPLVRATAMWTAVREMDDAERLKVHDHVLDFTDGPRRVATAAVETGIAGWRGRFLDPEIYDADGDGIFDSQVSKIRETVREIMDEHETKLDGALDELHDNVVSVRNTVLAVTNPKQFEKDRRRGLI